MGDFSDAWQRMYLLKGDDAVAVVDSHCNDPATPAGDSPFVRLWHNLLRLNGQIERRPNRSLSEDGQFLEP